jgi:hypothetical protein
VKVKFAQLCIFMFRTEYLQSMYKLFRMKNYSIGLLAFLIILTGCSGSDVYQGNWKATDSESNRFEIDFMPKSFKVNDLNGKVVAYEYTQNSVKIENSVRTYGIRLSDGRLFKILFPVAEDTSKGVLMLENDEPLYTICRTEYIEYKDLYNLME